MIRKWGAGTTCQSSRGFGLESRFPVSGFFTIRTLFQTMRPAYNSLKMMPMPRCALPLMVDAFQRVPRGGAIPSRLRSPAISRAGRLAA
jgi:hypothetical protein